MSNKFVEIETVRTVGGDKQICITGVNWDKLARSPIYQGVVVSGDNNGFYDIEEPVPNRHGNREIVSKTVKTDLACGFQVGDVVEYDDVYAEEDCFECGNALFYDEKQEEHYCPVCG
jgi:hypothetical protein